MGDNTTGFGKVTEFIRECWESNARKKGTVFINSE